MRVKAGAILATRSFESGTGGKVMAMRVCSTRASTLRPVGEQAQRATRLVPGVSQTPDHAGGLMATTPADPAERARVEEDGRRPQADADGDHRQRRVGRGHRGGDVEGLFQTRGCTPRPTNRAPAGRG